MPLPFGVRNKTNVSRAEVLNFMISNSAVIYIGKSRCFCVKNRLDLMYF